MAFLGRLLERVNRMAGAFAAVMAMSSMAGLYPAVQVKAGEETEPGESEDSPDTYPVPEGGWVCFHCGRRFLSPNSARVHFGPTPDMSPACGITDMEALRKLRATEGRIMDLEAGIDTVKGFLEVLMEHRWTDSTGHKEEEEEGPCSN